MDFESPPNPRAAIAFGVAILVVWVSALVLAFATGEPQTRREPSTTTGHVHVTGER